MYCKVINGQVVKYPYTIADLQFDYPNISFPVNDNGLTLPEADLADYNAFVVHPTDPSVDPITHSYFQADPQFVDGKWVQTWTITENDPALVLDNRLRIADFIGFYDELIGSGVYQGIRSQALSNVPLLLACTEFIAAFTDAKAGRPNYSALQACISNVVGQSTLTEEDIAYLQNLLQKHRMAELFTLG